MFEDFIGTFTRVDFVAGFPGVNVESYRNERSSEPASPLVSEEYFELIDVIAAVRSARQQFTMVEVGAGYGRWLVRAAVALRRINPMPCLLVGIEAEPTHFQWIKDHMLDNG